MNSFTAACQSANTCLPAMSVTIQWKCEARKVTKRTYGTSAQNIVVKLFKKSN